MKGALAQQQQQSEGGRVSPSSEEEEDEEEEEGEEGGGEEEVVMALPAQLRAIQHHLRTAAEHEQRDPVVAYYCESCVMSA